MSTGGSAKRGRPAASRTRALPTQPLGFVASQVADPRLVEERRRQIVGAAVKLFSAHGYYTTTIQQVAREAGISTGLVYQYFRDKDDLLLLALMQVLESYEKEIPRALEGVQDPVARLCRALATYCSVVDRMPGATVLTYRSSKSLRAERRVLLTEGEARTNRLLEACIRDCVETGHMRQVNEHLLAYSHVMFCHAWALKHWALAKRYTLQRYVAEGLALLVEPFLTGKGRETFLALPQ